jgi:hypothetical protein
MLRLYAQFVCIIFASAAVPWEIEEREAEKLKGPVSNYETTKGDETTKGQLKVTQV